MTRQLHAAGLVQNYGPRAARTRREMARFVASVRKVLWRRKSGVTMWVDRDWPQARAVGSSWLAWGRLDAPYAGWYCAAGPRALVHFSAKGGPGAAPPTLAA